jgi:acyl-CoA dehydrogenase
MMLPYTFETDEHLALREQVRRFAAREIAPYASAWEEAEEFPVGLYKSAADAGVLGVGYPEKYGGTGGDLSHMVVASEETILAGRSVGTAVGLGSHAIAVPPVLRVGTEEQKKRFVEPVLRGDKISALAITEPGGGSDVASLRTVAVRDGDYWVVNGSKTFITSGTRADQVTVAVRTGDRGHGGISLLIIERNTPGFTVGRKLRKMGWWASDTAELHFEDCRVPVHNLVGDVHSGFITIVQNFAVERVLIAAQCVAIATLAYQESITYS